MKKYPKIETIYNRDEDFKVIVGAHRRPEFRNIKQWLVTEKVDGTNIRLHFDRVEDNLMVSIAGKGPDAQVPPKLFARLQDYARSIHDKVGELMVDKGLEALTIYGEGYGAKIQKGGGLYRPDQDFVVFDMLVDNKAWLDDITVRENCETFGLDVVPYLGVMPEGTIVDLVLEQFNSLCAHEEKEAEGIVAKTPDPLYDRRGERLIWKLKARDFARPR